MTTEEEAKYYIDLYGYVPSTISIAFSLEDGMEWDSAEIAKQLRMAQAKIDELTLRITHPPKREWVGLKDEEKRQILLDDPIDWINAIEAKLREKNNGT